MRIDNSKFVNENNRLYELWLKGEYKRPVDSKPYAWAFPMKLRDDYFYDI